MGRSGRDHWRNEHALRSSHRLSAMGTPGSGQRVGTAEISIALTAGLGGGNFVTTIENKMLHLRMRFHLARRSAVFVFGLGVLLASAGICLGQSVTSSVICDRTHEGERGLYRGKLFQDWIEALRAGDVNIRREAAHSLDRYDPDAHSLVLSLFDTLSDPDPEVRQLGAQALGLLGNETDLALLLERARDDNGMVRASALDALGSLVASTGDECNPRKKMSPVPETVLSVLIEGLGDSTHAVRLAALQSLQRIGPDAAAATSRLREMLHEASVGGPAFLALYDIAGPDEIMRSGTGDALSSALRVTKDPDPWSRWRAVVALGRFGSLCAQPLPPNGCGDANVKAALRALEGALTDTGLSVRFSAAVSLGAFGAKARETLVAWSNVLKGDGDLAIPSAKALDEIGPAARQTVVASLLESLRAPSASHGDRLPTLKALQILSREAAQSGILIVAECLKQKDPMSRHAAAWTLGKMGNQAKPAIPALLAALRDPDPSVRFQVSSSLKKIGPGADAVVPLAMALRTGDADSRAGVAEVLGQMGSEASAAVPDLIGVLDDPSERLRGAAGSALRRIGPTSAGLIPSLKKQLRDEDPETRLRAVSAAATIGPAVSRTLVPELISALEDPDRRIRSTAIESLRELARDTGEAVPALALRIRDEDAMVRIVAAGALGEACRKAGAVVPALVGAVKDPEPSVRWTAINALENCGAEAALAVPALIEALKDERKEHRLTVLRVLGKIGPKARLATVPLIDLLQSDHEELRFSTGQTLLSIGPDRELAVPAYIEWLRDRSRKDRWISAYALGKFDAAAKQVCETLGWALRDPDDRVRIAAISSLSGLVPKSTDSLRVLAEALTDSAPTVRLESLHALAELGPLASGAVPNLIQALGDPEGSIRRQAATALGNIGPQAATAIPALRKVAKDTDPEVRAEATRVLGMLTAKP